MKIITLASWKGGTGKTTLGVSAITTLARQGKKVLVIDLDSNLSMTTVFNRVGFSYSTYDLLNGESRNEDLIHKTDFENISIIPSELKISRLSALRDKVLKSALKKLDLSGFDYVFIDPPGTMNALTVNAIVAADQVIVPAMPSSIDFEATELIYNEMIEMDVEADINIVLNGNDLKKNIDNIFNSFNESYAEFFYHSPISAMKSLKNLTANVSKYKLQGRAKEIIDQFVQEVIL